jgi:hypothetical protein
MKHRNERTEQNDSANFFENLSLFVLLMVLLIALTPGCATTPTTTVTSGSDNATVMASGLTVPDLIQYNNLAVQEFLTAWQLYESTKEASALQQTTWWLQYAAGVSAKIEALSATGS